MNLMDRMGIVHVFRTVMWRGYVSERKRMLWWVMTWYLSKLLDNMAMPPLIPLAALASILHQFLPIFVAQADALM
jgi:hypothetical protein